EAGIRDEHTNILLQDIWRYFRYTWSIPQTPIPGRKLLYLVRDRAHPANPVVGIAALCNCAVQVVPRDLRIGWSTRGLLMALKALFCPARERTQLERKDALLSIAGVYPWLQPLLSARSDPSHSDQIALLYKVHQWLLHGISEALGEIEQTGLVTPEEITEP